MLFLLRCVYWCTFLRLCWCCCCCFALLSSLFSQKESWGFISFLRPEVSAALFKRKFKCSHFALEIVLKGLRIVSFYCKQTFISLTERSIKKYCILVNFFSQTSFFYVITIQDLFIIYYTSCHKTQHHFSCEFHLRFWKSERDVCLRHLNTK